MKIKLGGLLLDRAATLVQPPAMNLELRQMRWMVENIVFNLDIPCLPLQVGWK